MHRRDWLRMRNIRIPVYIGPKNIVVFNLSNENGQRYLGFVIDCVCKHQNFLVNFDSTDE